MKQYDKEVEKLYGNTETYQEYTEKTKSYIDEKWDVVNVGMKKIFDDFYSCKSIGRLPSSNEAQGLVKKLQAYITENYYTCTDKILSGLGKLYISDERFKKNINKSGNGTAEYVSEAIEEFCEQNAK